MTDNQIDAFLERLKNDYETLMLQHCDERTTIQELNGYHRDVKIEVTSRLLREKWKAEMGLSISIPRNLYTQLQGKIEEVFTNLKIQFNKTEEKDNNNNKTDPVVSSTLPGSSKGLAPTLLSNLMVQNEKKDGDDIKKEFALGIDLGTTMCCIAVMCNGKVEVIQNRRQSNSKTTPSYVTFLKDGTTTFGHVAKDQAYKYPEATIYDAKRMIGKSWKDKFLQNDTDQWPFQVVEQRGNPKVKIHGRTRHPHDISARLLSAFRVMAEEWLNLESGTINKAVITVPAYFSEPQRRATNDAAVCAGLQVLNILSEPTAAAIAYNFERKTEGVRKTLIYDFGGGTFDVAIAIVASGKVDILCVNGDSHLGGQDLDQLLMDYCIEKFRVSEGIDLSKGKNSENQKVRRDALRALARIRLQCEKAKVWLSTTTTVTVEVDGIVNGKDLEVKVTRTLLEEMAKPMIEITLEIVEATLKDAASKGIKGREDIDDILLVGGSTRQPLVEKMVKEFFGGKELCKHINPDEVVAYGAAIQADILSRRSSSRLLPADVQIEDVTPLSLGIEILGDKFSRVIERNTKIPCEFEEVYVTCYDNQISAWITVYQGESNKASQNVMLGEFHLEGIPPAPAGQEKVKITMTIDSMGILVVKAVSLSNGKENAVTITSQKLGMNEAEIKQLSKELENQRI